MLSEILNEVHSLRLIVCRLQGLCICHRSVFPDQGSTWPMIHWEYWVPYLPAEALSSVDEPGDAEM